MIVVNLYIIEVSGFRRMEDACSFVSDKHRSAGVVVDDSVLTRGAAMEFGTSACIKEDGKW